MLRPHLEASSAVVKTLIKNGYLESNPEKVERNPFIHHIDVKSVDLELTDEQEIAYNTIINDMKSKGLNLKNTIE